MGKRTGKNKGSGKTKAKARGERSGGDKKAKLLRRLAALTAVAWTSSKPAGSEVPNSGDANPDSSFYEKFRLHFT